MSYESTEFKVVAIDGEDEMFAAIAKTANCSQEQAEQIWLAAMAASPTVNDSPLMENERLELCELRELVEVLKVVVERDGRRAGVAVGAEPETALPPSNCRQRLAAEGKLYPKSSCPVCGKFSPKMRECDALIVSAEVKS
jgi:hypothetical protein